MKQVRCSTHRTLHKTFGARHPSSVTPLTGRASFPPGEAERACADSPWCIPIGILRTANPSGAMRRPQLCMKQLYAVKDGYTC